MVDKVINKKDKNIYIVYIPIISPSIRTHSTSHSSTLHIHPTHHTPLLPTIPLSLQAPPNSLSHHPFLHFPIPICPPPLLNIHLPPIYIYIYSHIYIYYTYVFLYICMCSCILKNVYMHVRVIFVYLIHI